TRPGYPYSAATQFEGVTIRIRVKDPLSKGLPYFANVVTLLLNWKMNARLGSADRGFVASVVGGGVIVDFGGG
nr:hypothetical protein [Tanacetum cinerariifolium]